MVWTRTWCMRCATCSLIWWWLRCYTVHGYMLAFWIVHVKWDSMINFHQQVHVWGNDDVVSVKWYLILTVFAVLTLGLCHRASLWDSQWIHLFLGLLSQSMRTWWRVRSWLRPPWSAGKILLLLWRSSTRERPQRSMFRCGAMNFFAWSTMFSADVLNNICLSLNQSFRSRVFAWLYCRT